MDRKNILKIATAIDPSRVLKILKEGNIEEAVTCITYKEKDGELVPNGFELRLKHSGMPTTYTRVRFKMKVIK